MNSERITGVVVLLLAVLIYFVLIPWGVVSPSNIKHASTAPYFWPGVIAGIMGVTGILMILFSGAASATDADMEIEELSSETPWLQRIPRLLLILGLLFAFYFAIPHLGMVVPGIVLIFFLMLYAGQRRLGLMIGLSIGVPLVLYGFFVYVANIPIPLGWFEVLRG